MGTSSADHLKIDFCLFLFLQDFPIQLDWNNTSPALYLNNPLIDNKEGKRDIGYIIYVFKCKYVKTVKKFIYIHTHVSMNALSIKISE